jgi:putative addiction module killer protein
LKSVEVRRYLNPAGKDVFGQWLRRCADPEAKARVLIRIARLEAGHDGDCKSVGGGIWEMRIDHGPGYRVYYARVGREVVLLLCAGDKRTQRHDIASARTHLIDYKKRSSKAS